jgi:hypothetical protein
MKTYVHINTPEDREHLVAFEIEGKMYNELLRNSDLSDIDEIAIEAWKQRYPDLPMTLVDLNIIKPEAVTQI